MRIATILIALACCPGVAVAQSADTRPAPAQATRAAGMALQDGTLPPGTLTVRVVRGSFSGNLAGINVTLEVGGEAPKEAMTRDDGRAQFAHLALGSSVRATATVDGEPLASEPIVMPAESGIRVLLVAGGQFVDTTKQGEVASLPPIADAPALPPAPAPPIQEASQASPVTSRLDGNQTADPAARFQMVMIALTVLAFVAVGYGQWRRRR